MERSPFGAIPIATFGAISTEIFGALPLLLALGILASQLAPAVARWAGARSMELVVLDVGQGAGLLIRTPGFRWVLVDAGPRTPGRAGSDAGARVIETDWPGHTAPRASSSATGHTPSS